MSATARAIGMTALLLSAGITQADFTTVAHWNFESETDFNSGIIKDVTGNGNDLSIKQLPGTTVAEQAKFVTTTADGTAIDVLGAYNSDGALQFNGTKNGANGKAGSYLQTFNGAPLNSNQFTDGYTFEAVFKLPENRTAADHAWMGIVTREGKPNGDPAVTLSISNLGEAQWVSNAVNGADPVSQPALWSFDLDTSPGFHHVAITSEFNDETSLWDNTLFVDGVKGTRNSSGLPYGGLFEYSTESEEFVWNVGLSVWGGPTAPGNADGAFNGVIDDIRISEGVVPVEQFSVLVPEPTSVVVFGVAGLLMLTRRRHN